MTLRSQILYSLGIWCEVRWNIVVANKMWNAPKNSDMWKMRGDRSRSLTNIVGCEELFKDG